MRRSRKILSCIVGRNLTAIVACILIPIGSAVAQPVFLVDSHLDQIDVDTADGICETLAGT